VTILSDSPRSFTLRTMAVIFLVVISKKPAEISR